ncbi:hypothetical protein MNAN1_003485 [Malassezia nana]|uniref:Uncharacterized protein n=1 Tax=Malassezia nana TaxID=180528 RepID=A0AAF0EMD8_9BASI|nr:hypothetical protein MNAN1_003485 [Malassezia nana]
MRFAALLLALAAVASAVPLSRRDEIASCGNGGDIDVTRILSQVQQAPRENRSSGYPHQFKNYEGLPMSSDCDGASMMLELPVFADGHPYNLQNGENPGAVRAIYSIDDNALCAIIAHDNYGSDFHLCPMQ